MWKYKKTEPSNEIGLCVRCGINLQKRKTNGKYRSICSVCDRELYKHVRNYRPQTKVKKDYCESCGFEGHYCQLDVDHIDGNHDNNNPDNLQTLCANCHRLKTFIHQDWRPSAKNRGPFYFK